MKTNCDCSKWLKFLAFLALTFCLHPSTAFAQSTAFSYQSRLNDNGSPANGLYDVRFHLFDAPSNGNLVAGPLTNTAVGVRNGLFMVTLDFGGGVFTGPDRWLQLDVRTNGGDVFIPLLPRQQILPMPYALMAGTASNLLGVLPATQLSGAIGNGQLANNSVTVNAGIGLSGGGVLPLGGSMTLANAGVYSVNGNADITASPTSGTVALATTATDANLASRMVKRDGGGNFSAGSITLSGNLNLPATTATAGTINLGGNRLLHSYGNQNVFAGIDAGNFTLSGSANVGLGYGALASDTSGSGNTAIGPVALASNTSGSANIASGYYALGNNTSGSDNLAYGNASLSGNTNGNFNSAFGDSALSHNTSGSYNIALGYLAGYRLTTGSNNIDIGNYGAAGESGIIRIGTQGTQVSTFLAGVYGNTVNGGVPVYVNSSGALGAASDSPVALLNGANTFSGANTYAGVVIAENANNSFKGTFAGALSGNVGNFGAGNISANSLSANTYYGTSFNGGYFFGNGSGLGNLSAGSLVGTIPTGCLGGTYQNSVTFNNAGNSFSGSFNGNINGNINGYHYGDGSGLYNLNANFLANGFVPDARLGANLARLDRDATFSGTVTSSADLVAGRLNIGENNVLQAADAASITGGSGNLIYAGATDAVISGGNANSIGAIGPGATSTVIAGGDHNIITNATAAIIPGGSHNVVGGSYSLAAGRYAQALHIGVFVWGDTAGQPISSTTDNQFTARANGGFRLFTQTWGGNNYGAALGPGQTSWASLSDSNLKKNRTAVDVRLILEKLATIPVEHWNYKWEDDTATAHLGPMAQAFKTAFYPGRDDKSITTLEFDGVELAAIQGLNQKLNEKDAEIQMLKEKSAKLDALEQQNKSLSERLSELETLVKELATQK